MNVAPAATGPASIDAVGEAADMDTRSLRRQQLGTKEAMLTMSLEHRFIRPNETDIQIYAMAAEDKTLNLDQGNTANLELPGIGLRRYPQAETITFAEADGEFARLPGNDGAGILPGAVQGIRNPRDRNISPGAPRSGRVVLGGAVFTDWVGR